MWGQGGGRDAEKGFDAGRSGMGKRSSIGRRGRDVGNRTDLDAGGSGMGGGSNLRAVAVWA